MNQQIKQQIQELIARGAMFVVNHSGGKDSQAMFHMVMDIVPREQVVVVHALLPDVEWEGVEEHVRATTLGVPVYTCQSRRTLLQMIEERGMFPSPSQRQCTSDLKRGPIERTIRQLTKERIEKYPDHKGIPVNESIVTWRDAGANIIVNCMGMRAEESSSRSKLNTFKFSERNSKNGREWYDWLPIHEWKVGEVFAKIASVGQKPHWAYEAGMSRLSCVFCIMSSKKDLITAAKLNPSLYKTYVNLERSTGQVMLMPSKTKGRLTLEQVTGIYIDEPEQVIDREPVPEASFA